MRPLLSLLRVLGVVALSAVALLALAAPFVAPNGPDDLFDGRGYAPPVTVRVRDAQGWRRPFVHPLVIEDRAMQQYREDTTRAYSLTWFDHGHLVSLPPEAGPLLLLGADPLGRDVFSRLIHGARLSLGVVAFGLCGALAIGILIGGLAGMSGGRLDDALMAAADLVLVLPGAYLVLALRGMLPLTLTTAQVFMTMVVLFAVSAWPQVARGVRAILASERTRDYVEAARALGAGRLRLLGHVLPAIRGFVAVQVVLLVPALLVAELTVSFLGLGFPVPSASWGIMLQDAQSTRALDNAPWLLAPAAATFVLVISLHLVAGPRATTAALESRAL